LHEMRGDRHAAMNNYRIALDLDPTYEPARNNMNQPAAAVRSKRSFDLG
jgi:hypothetical protein